VANTLSGSVAVEIIREMGCTPEDLMRWLAKALGDLYQSTSLVIDDRELLHGTPPRILLQGATLQSRKIALLSIPVLKLRITFDKSFSVGQIESILSRFDLYTRRGGG
jgi:hypothetical protein